MASSSGAWLRLAAVFAVLGWAGTSPLAAQEVDPQPPEVVPAPVPVQPISNAAPGDAPKDYGPVEAGQEAYQRAEAERQEAFNRQRDLNEQMRATADPYSPVRPSLAGAYAMFPPAPLPPIAFGPRRARYAAQSQVRYSYYYPYPMIRAYRGVFEPWPFVPGDIYGYPYVPQIRMPTGQVQIEIGPGRILSRPVYEGEGPAQEPTPAPPRAAEGQPEIVPPPAAPELNPPGAPQPPPPAPKVPPPPAPPGPREF